MNMLQEKMVMYSKCIALFNEGDAKRTEVLKIDEEKKAKKEAFYKFINDADKK